MPEATEPLLTETASRHVMFPVEYPDVWEMYKRQVGSFWTADEIDFKADLVDLPKLNADELHFITHILAFFAASDGIVSENLSMRFSNEVPKAEVRASYAIQNAIEQIHSETYSLLIDTYVRDQAEKARLFNAVENFPAIREKAQWGMKWIQDREASFAQRLVAFAIVEGLFFSASFCAIFWMRKRNLLPGLSFANQLISRDEGMHTEFACLLYSKLINQLPVAAVHAMIEEAVDIETRFITESIPVALIGMNSELMRDYIRYIGDRLLVMLGYAKLYNKANPFEFMELSSMESKGNFFETRISEYSKAVLGSTDALAIDDDADF
jgi:ribonucleoside-diphosphate reductase beta chain